MKYICNVCEEPADIRIESKGFVHPEIVSTCHVALVTPKDEWVPGARVQLYPGEPEVVRA